jgi:glucose/arabinose dehydrogenase
MKKISTQFWVESKSILRTSFALLITFCLFSSVLVAQTPPANFNNNVSQGGFDQPMGSAFTKDGTKMFVWDKAGRVYAHVWDATNKVYNRQTQPMLDISEEVGNWRDFGCMSFILDPNFDTNGLVYLMYIVDRHHLLNFGTPSYNPLTNEYYAATISRITRFKTTVNGTVFSTNYTTRKVLVGESKSTGIPLTHESHGSGTLVFGSDGTLMACVGDNASYSSTDKGSAGETYFQQAINDGIIRSAENVGAYRSQMLTSHCGKVLRIDPVTGDGVSSNPFFEASNPRAAKSRVWALGLRNPFRMNIKPNSGSTNPADANPGTLLIGDVGWGAWEDLHIVSKPAQNCGWPIFEGLDPHPGYSTNTPFNLEELNPLFGQNGCTQQYLKFEDLLKQETSPAQIIYNPCSGSIPLAGNQARYVHSRPALDWQHGANNARSGTFNNGAAVATTIGTAGSPITGTPFGGNAAVGGTWYDGNDFPADYKNTFFQADYGGQWIRNVSFDANGNTNKVRNFIDGGAVVVHVAQNPLDGTIFYTDIAKGTVNRVSYGGNQPPKAVLEADKTFGNSPLTVNFKGDKSSDPEGKLASYEWDFGDGSAKETIANPTHIFSSTGIQSFTVTLKVTDDKGLTDSKTQNISLNNTAPTVKITSPADNSKYSLNGFSTINLRANVADAQESNSTLKYEWRQTLRHNNHQHTEPAITTQDASAVISPVGCDGETYYYMFALRVTDAGGLVAEDSVKIYPDCNSTSLNIKNLAATPKNNSVDLSWINPTASFDEVFVVAKEGSGFVGQPTGDGNAYTANPDFGGNGSAFEGGKVVYDGTATAITVSGLNPYKKYFFRVYVRKGSAWNGGTEISAIPNTTTVCAAKGYAYQEVWTGLDGNNDLGNFPTQTPTRSDKVTLFEIPTDVADTYASRIRAYICAPETGNYTFWISSDDYSELYLSSDDNPANKTKIAYIYEWTASRQWDKFPTQKSLTVSLLKDRKYYVEAIMKEGYGGDNLAVGWQLPSNPTGAITVIPGTVMSPYPEEIIKQNPVITWAKPADIIVGAALDNLQLNATANVAGTFTYNPASGTVLNVGNNQVLNVSFSPTDQTNYNNVTGSQTINVLAKVKQNPIITWAKPADITVGTALGNTQLNATANVAGTFTYNPASGTGLNVGNNQILNVSFNPTDQTNYNNVTGSQTINVLPKVKQNPVITWTKPADITVGAALDNLQLNATANVAGTFTYNPASGTVLNVGNNQVLNVSFSPTDQTNYNNVTGSQTINVLAKVKQNPIITWAKPADITEGVALGNVQLNATANVAGTFTYNPASGTVLNVGNNQVLNVSFNPTDQTNYNNVTGSQTINVLPKVGDCTGGIGYISREYWGNVTGNFTSNIPTNQTPSSRAMVMTRFEGQIDVADNYGTRYRGFVCVPETGAYTFWISSDDNSDLWLSTDENPNNKARIASINGWTSPREWTKYASQKSATITLTKGKRYYIEALQKEGGGLDNLAVGWQLPSAPTAAVQVIPASVLSPFDTFGKQTPSVTWVKPQNIAQGTLLDNNQLDAKANVPGTWTYSPAVGTAMNTLGTQILTAYFVPTDANTYNDVLITRTVSVIVKPNLCVNKAGGSLTREVWTNIQGWDTSTIPVTKKPNAITSVKTFEGPINVGDYYGDRYRGYITAPLTGNYTFWVSGDDFSDFYLSTDENPANKVKLASIVGWTNSRVWTKYPSQKSVQIPLVAGKKYYVEGLHKEGAGGDNFAVGWQTPDYPNAPVEVVPSCVLSPFPVTGARLGIDSAQEDGIILTIFPNPFSDELVVEFSLQETGNARLTLLDINGKETLQLFDGEVQADQNTQVTANTHHLSEGTFLLRLSTNNRAMTRKVILQR